MTTPQKYRKKPVVIEAMRWDGTAQGATPIINWILANGGTARYVGKGESHPMRHSWESPTGEALPSAPEFLVIDTLEGAHRQDVHDFTIQGVQGEFYPCKPDIFKATYEAA